MIKVSAIGAWHSSVVQQFCFLLRSPQSTTVMPMFLAVPSMMRMPASTVMAFKSGSFVSAISCSIQQPKTAHYPALVLCFPGQSTKDPDESACRMLPWECQELQLTRLPSVAKAMSPVLPTCAGWAWERALSCARVTWPTLAELGVPDPFATPAAF